ncbi:hypothetical protein JCM10449v2_007743 [Rhodotorula kratochvilovae]
MASTSTIQPAVSPSKPPSSRASAATILPSPGTSKKWTAQDDLAVVTLVNKHKTRGEEGEGVNWEAVEGELKAAGRKGELRRCEGVWTALKDEVEGTLAAFLDIEEGVDEGHRAVSPIFTVHERDVLIRAHKSVFSDKTTVFGFTRVDSNPHASGNAGRTWEAIHAAFSSSCKQQREPARTAWDLFVAFHRPFTKRERAMLEGHALRGQRFVRDKPLNRSEPARVVAEVEALGGDRARDDAGWTGEVERVVKWTTVRAEAAKRRSVATVIEGWWGRFDQVVEEKPERATREDTSCTLAQESSTAQHPAANWPLDLSQTQPRSQERPGGGRARGGTGGGGGAAGLGQEVNDEDELEQEQEKSEADGNDEYAPSKKTGGAKQGRTSAKKGAESRARKPKVQGHFNDVEDRKIGLLYRRGEPDSAIARELGRTPTSVKGRMGRMLYKQKYFNSVIDGPTGVEHLEHKKRARSPSPPPMRYTSPSLASWRARSFSPLPSPRYTTPHAAHGANVTSSVSTTAVPDSRFASPELAGPSDHAQPRAGKRAKAASSPPASEALSLTSTQRSAAIRRLEEQIAALKEGSWVSSRASK